jgi:hypothetical protein
VVDVDLGDLVVASTVLSASVVCVLRPLSVCDRRDVFGGEGVRSIFIGESCLMVVSMDGDGDRRRLFLGEWRRSAVNSAVVC